ncbi:DUF934 domain-containing protein [Solimonas sp. SE-A11]|uniref:DUF934 domain-containing protein n=1 Tax=Solimonas sp. SE-A11 TaxID=3054954 RepID=UPI00259D14A9|nr:DUF934 domain-containing protein [Solimonas sp. SE-A11]MDM4768755.1 DUF934 domain-containing protein [Solimonas sp. SE-A11]
MPRADIQPTAANARLIKLIDGQPRLVADQWQLLAPGSVAVSRKPILHMASWAQRPRGGACGIWIGPDDDFETRTGFLTEAALIAVRFPSFRDARSLSVAHRLRQQHGWTGELRAFGDVLRGQLRQMRRCGFDSFELAPGQDPQDALKALATRSLPHTLHRSTT